MDQETMQERIMHMPWTLFLTLVMQFIGVLIWATQLEARVEHTERLLQGAMALNEKFARLEERIDGVKQEMAGMREQAQILNKKLFEEDRQNHGVR